MTQPSIPTLIGASFSRVGQTLFTPVLFSRWLRFMVIAGMAGCLGIGGCGLNDLRSSLQKSTSSASSPGATAQDTPAKKPSDSRAEQLLESARDRYRFVDGVFRPDPSQYPPLSKAWLAAVLGPLAIFLLLAIMALWIFWVWLSVRFKFMWYYAVRQGDAAIRTLFARCRTEADELFDFWLVLTFLEWVVYGLAAAWLLGAIWGAAGGWQNRPDWDGATALGLAGPPLGAFVTAWLFFTGVRVVGDDFLVPLTIRYPGPARSVWQKWTAIYRARRRAVWGYLGLRLLITLAWGAFQTALLVAWVVLWAVVWALLSAAFGLSARSWPALNGGYLFFGVLAGVPVLAVLLFGAAATYLPGAVFIRDFSARMLERLDPS